MSPSRRQFLQTGAAAAAGLMLPNVASAIGRVRRADTFEPTWASLSQFQTPEWFRDAKFGMWAHWGPQAVPRQGDWYAKRMYQHDAPGRGG